MTRPERIRALLRSARRLATDAANGCADWQQGSEWSRVVDCVDAATARVEYLEPVA